MKKTSIFAFVVMVIVSLFLSDGRAENIKVPPSSTNQAKLSYAPVVKNAAPAVVNIYTRKVVQQRVVSPFLDDPFFQHFFGKSLPQGLSRKRLEQSLGSGVIVRSDGLIVTSNHVIAGADQITVVLSDRREFEATLVTTDDRSDLAVLHIDTKGESLPFLQLKDSDEIEVGDLVLAIGNPFGVGQTVTNGIVSALARTSLDINDLNYFIQTDAAINPGNSGGALVSMDGKLVGINSAIYSRDGGNMGIGFAIPSNMVRTIIAAVSSGKKSVVRPWIGINGQDVTAEVATSLNLARPSGMLINEIHQASPAKKAGLKAGDVIVGVNGKSIEDPAAFRYRIATLAVGSDAVLDVQRGGKSEKVSIKLIAPPEDPPRDETTVKGRNPLAGAVIANLSPAVNEEYGIRGVERGVIVLKLIANDAPAAGVGIQPGDIVLKINNTETATVREVMSALKGSDINGWRVTIRRGDNVINFMVGR